MSLLAVVLVAGAFAYVFLRSGWIEVDQRHFDRRVLQAPRPALVYFDTAIGCRDGDWVFRKLSRRWRGVLDVFYVTERGGSKVSNPDHIAGSIRQRLLDTNGGTR